MYYPYHTIRTILVNESSFINMAIWFDINPRSGVPIFKQIVAQVRRAIATGMLAPDEQLPTVRELADEHSINPNTTAKAYHDLKTLGLVYTRPGVGGGIFVQPGVEKAVRELELVNFQEEIRRLIREGHNLGLSQAEFYGLFQLELDNWYKTHPLSALN